jgi:hypothetical protein
MRARPHRSISPARSSNGVSFTGVGTSAAFDLPLTAGVKEFPVSMPVRAGDYIGIDLPAGGKEARIVARDEDAFQAARRELQGEAATDRPLRRLPDPGEEEGQARKGPFGPAVK